MVEGITIKFGYGDVGMWANFGQLHFIQLETTEDLGKIKDFGKHEYTGKVISIDITEDDYNMLDSHLSAVVFRKINSFAFKGCILDFTNYDKKCVDNLRVYARKAVEGYHRCTAI